MLHHQCHHPPCRPPHVLAVESVFHHLRALRRNRARAELYRRRPGLHERVAPTMWALLAARGLEVVPPVASVDLIVPAAREAHGVPMARVDQEVHRPVPTVQEVVQEVVQEDPEVDRSRDVAVNKSVGDVSRKSYSHKSWQRIRRLTPRYPKVRLSLSEVQRRRK